MTLMILTLMFLCSIEILVQRTSAAYQNEINDQQNTFTWVPVPIKATKDPKRAPSGAANDRRGIGNSYDENYDHNRGEYQETASSYNAPSGFDSGFGMVQNSVGFSALGFMGFLFFLKLIQDTITMVNGPMGRSSNMYFAKRAIESFDDSWNGIISFYVSFINEDDVRCRRQMVCELRASLIKRYKRVGRVASSLMSEILDPILRDKDSNRMKWFSSNDSNCEFHSGYCFKAGE